MDRKKPFTPLPWRGQSRTEHCKPLQPGSLSFFFFFFLPLKKFSGSLGEGQCRFFFVIMGPFVEMEEEKRSVRLRCARFPVIPRVPSQRSWKALGPCGAGQRGGGLVQDGADGAAQCSGYSPALCVALSHRGLESDCSEERTQVLAAGTAQSSPVPGDRAHPQV